MSVNPNQPADNTALGNARWGTAVIILVVAIATLVVFYVINNDHSPAPQPVNATMPNATGSNP
jgi:hypothetical protein